MALNKPKTLLALAGAFALGACEAETGVSEAVKEKKFIPGESVTGCQKRIATSVGLIINTGISGDQSWNLSDGQSKPRSKFRDTRPKERQAIVNHCKELSRRQDKNEDGIYDHKDVIGVATKALRIEALNQRKVVRDWALDQGWSEEDADKIVEAVISKRIEDVDSNKDGVYDYRDVVSVAIDYVLGKKWKWSYRQHEDNKHLADYFSHGYKWKEDAGPIRGSVSLAILNKYDHDGDGVLTGKDLAPEFPEIRQLVQNLIIEKNIQEAVFKLPENHDYKQEITNLLVDAIAAEFGIDHEKAVYVAFALLDINTDGEISHADDINGDGVLSKEDFLAIRDLRNHLKTKYGGHYTREIVMADVLFYWLEQKKRDYEIVDGESPSDNNFSLLRLDSKRLKHSKWIRAASVHHEKVGEHAEFRSTSDSGSLGFDVEVAIAGVTVGDYEEVKEETVYETEHYVISHEKLENTGQVTVFTGPNGYKFFVFDAADMLDEHRMDEFVRQYRNGKVIATPEKDSKKEVKPGNKHPDSSGRVVVWDPTRNIRVIFQKGEYAGAFFGEDLNNPELVHRENEPRVLSATFRHNMDAVSNGQLWLEGKVAAGYNHFDPTTSIERQNEYLSKLKERGVPGAI